MMKFTLATDGEKEILPHEFELVVVFISVSLSAWFAVEYCAMVSSALISCLSMVSFPQVWVRNTQACPIRFTSWILVLWLDLFALSWRQVQVSQGRQFCKGGPLLQHINLSAFFLHHTAIHGQPLEFAGQPNTHLQAELFVIVINISFQPKPMQFFFQIKTVPLKCSEVTHQVFRDIKLNSGKWFSTEINVFT